MLNLLRFAQPDGRAAYGRYTAVAMHTVQARGGSVPYMGQSVSGDHSGWDTATLVRYPRRAAYLDMQSDPAYVGAIPDRTAGLAARLITPFFLPGGSPDEPLSVATASDDEVLVVCVDNGAQHPGETLLALDADVPMVTDTVWSKLAVIRFGSVAEACAQPPAEGIWMVTRS